MKLLSRLLIVLLACLIAIPVLTFTSPVQANESPTISVHPTSGNVGDAISVYGENFTANDTVAIYYYISYSSSSDYERVLIDSVTVESGGIFAIDSYTIPESCRGNHYIRAYHVDTFKASTTFTVKPMVEITSPSSAEGYVGDEITIEGTGFKEDEEDIEIRYYHDGTHIDFAVVEDADAYGTWEQTFTVPHSVKGEHKIDAYGYTTTLAEVTHDTFTAKPEISLDKTSGCVGDIITVNGTGFEYEESNIKITYDDSEVEQIVAADTDTYGSWEATFEVPPCTKGSYEVDARGQYTYYTEVADVTFTVGSGVSLSPALGHVGTIITVTGSGFAANKDVTITYDGVTKATTNTTSEGSFSGVSFSATHTQSVHTVNHPVNATDTASNTATANFVMESFGPASPTPISPANGTRVSFFGSFTGKIRPTFQWSNVTDDNVTDDSGIIGYELQISTNSTSFPETISIPSENVTAAGNNLAYTLDKALSTGLYYWRVRAIDGAQNQGEWSNVQLFRAGFLPRWAAITIAALLVVLIGILVYYFVFRRRLLYD